MSCGGADRALRPWRSVGASALSTALVAALGLLSSANAWAQFLGGAPSGLSSPLGSGLTLPNTAGTAAPGLGVAGTKPLEFTLRTQLAYSSNRNVANAQGREDGLTLDVTPRMLLRFVRPTFQVTGSIGVSGYLNLFDFNDARASPDINLTGRWEVIRRAFYVDTSARVSRQYFSPFGSQSDTSTRTNTYVQSTYRVSPYFQGNFTPNTSYLARYDWSRTNAGSPTLAATTAGTGQTTTGTGFGGDSDQQNILARVTQTPLPVGWELQYNNNTTSYPDRPHVRIESGRARLAYRPIPDVQVAAIGGYERTEFQSSEQRGSIVGGSLFWRPSLRTSFNGTYERRYFGPSHQIAFDHRWPGFAINIFSNRDITTYQQLVAALPAGGIVPLLLDQQFQTRIPDANERLQVVNEFIRSRGLDLVSSNQQLFYSQDLILRSAAGVNFILTGRVQSLTLSVFRNKTTGLSGGDSSVPQQFTAAINNVSTGFSANYSYKLSSRDTVSLFGSRIRVDGTGIITSDSLQQLVRVTLNSQVSSRTSIFSGLRYQNFHAGGSIATGVTSSYIEWGAFVGADLRF